MSWDAISALGEIIAAIAVVVSLGYLAVQIRQNTRMMKAQTRDSLASKQMMVGAYVFTEAGMAEVVTRGIRGELVQGDPDYLKFAGFLTANFREWENSYHQYSVGLYDLDDLQSRKLRWSTVLQSDSVQERWMQDRETYSSIFRSEIDSIVDGIRHGGDA